MSTVTTWPSISPIPMAGKLMLSICRHIFMSAKWRRREWPKRWKLRSRLQSRKRRSRARSHRWLQSPISSRHRQITRVQNHQHPRPRSNWLWRQIIIWIPDRQTSLAPRMLVLRLTARTILIINHLLKIRTRALLKKSRQILRFLMRKKIKRNKKTVRTKNLKIVKKYRNH